MSGGIVYRDVEIRTWPERSDLLVIDVITTRVIAHYPLPADDDEFAGSGPLFDPLSGYAERADAAIAAVESDQPFLQAIFGEGDDPVCLRGSGDCRHRLAELLESIGLTLDDVGVGQLGELEAKLDAIEIDKLYQLLCDWHDVVERHYPAGASVDDPESWVHRARPDSCFHFHYLACGGDRSTVYSPGDDDLAHELFRGLIDVELADFTFGLFLRWVYFHRTEFAERERFQLRALSETQPA